MPRGAPAAMFVLAAALAPGRARADGLDFDLVGARAIGRAGTQAVSGDGGAALLVNPAGLARRPEKRVQIGISLHDDDAAFRAPGADAIDAPTVADRSGPVASPSIAVHGALGPVVLGVAVLDTGHLERRMPSPAPDQPAEDVDRLFPHRYGGLELAYRKRAAVAGAATRVGDWLGVGASLGVADVELAERRHIWAGFTARGDMLAYPDRDLDLGLRARDRLVPLAAGGVLIAPPELPIELGAGVSWSAEAHADGEAEVSRAGDPSLVSPADATGTTSVRLGSPTSLRGGVRYLGERVTAEIGGDLTWFAGGKRPVWRPRSISVRDEPSGVTADVPRIPSLAVRRNHGAVRGAIDVEVARGLLWLTGGYAYATAATSRSRLAPAFGDTGGHTIAIGAEASWNQVTFTFGYARLIAPAVEVGDEETSVDTVNPFGPSAGVAPVGAGEHRRGHDAVGFTAEVAWD